MGGMLNALCQRQRRYTTSSDGFVKWHIAFCLGLAEVVPHFADQLAGLVSYAAAVSCLSVEKHISHSAAGIAFR
jgi:hypothetical protein